MPGQASQPSRDTTKVLVLPCTAAVQPGNTSLLADLLGLGFLHLNLRLG